MTHQNQISKGLGIQAIAHSFSSFYFKGNDDYRGMQIDLLIDRADGVINLCEIKFSNANYVLTNDYKRKLQQRAVDFAQISKSKKAIMTTLITTYGLDNKDLHLDTIQNVLIFDILFIAPD